ncbi:MAG: OB-fold protein [Deltaproteobacteria bacterium]
MTLKNCKACRKGQGNSLVRNNILLGIILLLILGNTALLVGCGSKPTNSITPAPAAENTSNSNTTPNANTQVKEEPKETPKAEEPKVEAVKLSAADLYKAFEEDSEKAVKTYKLKLVEVTGKITEVEDVFGDVQVYLSNEKPNSDAGIRCSFSDDSEIDKAKKLKKGDTVTIQGQVTGAMTNVILDECIIK